MHLHVSDHHGASMLEVLVGVMLVAVLAVMIFTAFAIGLRAAAFAQGVNTALGLAEEALTAVAVSSCNPSVKTGQTSETLSPPLTQYQREVIARPLPGPRQWEVSVNVTWRQRRQRHSVSLTTYRFVSRACEIVGQ